jgi:hypothetical protein
VRYVKTDQTVGGFVSRRIRATPRRARAGPPNGARYPNFDQFVYLERDYNNTLPSATGALTIMKDLVLRALGIAHDDASRPERDPPEHQLQLALGRHRHDRQHRPRAVPVGQPRRRLRVVHGGSGYVSVTPFYKKIKGFTTNQNTTLPFTALAAYGVTYDSLTPTQQAGLNARGGPTPPPS